MIEVEARRALAAGARRPRRGVVRSREPSARASAPRRPPRAASRAARDARRHRAEPRAGPRARALGPRLHGAGDRRRRRRHGLRVGAPGAADPLPRLGRRHGLPRLQLARRDPRRRGRATRAARTLPRRATTRATARRPRASRSATTAAGNQIGVAPGARLIGCRNMDRRQRDAGALHRVLRVVPGADGRAAAQNPRPDLGRRRHQQLVGLPGERGLHGPGHPQGRRRERARGGHRRGRSRPATREPRAATLTRGARVLRRRLHDRGDRPRRHDRELLELGPVTQRRLEPPEARHLRAGREPAHVRARGDVLRPPSPAPPAAAPHVAGAIALLWSAVPGAARATWTATERAARATARAADVDAELRRLLRLRRPQPRLRLGPPRRREAAYALRATAAIRAASSRRAPARPRRRAAAALTVAIGVRSPPYGHSAPRKRSPPTRTTLEIEVPAEEVEKAFGAVTTRVRQAGRDPGLPQGARRPESVVQKRFADEIQGDVLEARPARRPRLGDRGDASSRCSAGRTSRT